MLSRLPTLYSIHFPTSQEKSTSVTHGKTRLKGLEVGLSTELVALYFERAIDIVLVAYGHLNA